MSIAVVPNNGIAYRQSQSLARINSSRSKTQKALLFIQITKVDF